jgi:hypothetical protein
MHWKCEAMAAANLNGISLPFDEERHRDAAQAESRRESRKNHNSTPVTTRSKLVGLCSISAARKTFEYSTLSLFWLTDRACGTQQS